MQASQQVSLLASSATPGFIPGAAEGACAFAGVAQLVEHLFCKQVVSGSIPLASSDGDLASFSSHASSVLVSEISEGCPSGQREQAVNLPARAYVGSNPTPSTSVCHGSSAPPRRSEFGGAPPQVLGPRPQNSRRGSFVSAGVTQLVESQFSKLKVDGSSPFSRSNFPMASRFSTRTSTSRTLKQTRFASLVAGEAEARTGAERTPVREHRTGAEAQPPAKIAGRGDSQANVSAHLAQLVEHVLGKDEVISSNLMVGSTEVQP